MLGKNKHHIAGLGILLAASSFGAEGPMYKPSYRSVEPVDISLNAYGASPMAPAALNLADTAPGFVLPVSGGGEFDLALANKPVVIIFYRGHW